MEDVSAVQRKREAAKRRLEAAQHELEAAQRELETVCANSRAPPGACSVSTMGTTSCAPHGACSISALGTESCAPPGAILDTPPGDAFAVGMVHHRPEDRVKGDMELASLDATPVKHPNPGARVQ